MLTIEEIDKMIADEDARWEARETFEEAHAMARAHHTEGESYRATFGASVKETRRIRARKESERAHREWFRATYCR